LNCRGSDSAPPALAEAVDERVGEAADVAGGHPDLRVHDDRGLQPDHVVAELDRVPPPELADVAPEGDAVGPVVVQPPETAVDLAGGVHEPAALAERRDLLHQVLTFTDHA